MFLIDEKWARLLSDFFLDIAKACFITAFITPLSNNYQLSTQIFVLIKGLLNVMIYLSIARFIKNYELN